jgi:hypothetical protein
MIDSSSTPTNDQIARRAYEIFIERGQPAGQDLAHWLEAEKQLRAAGQPKAAAPIPSAPMRATQPATSSNGKTGGNGRTQARAGAGK